LNFHFRYAITINSLLNQNNVNESLLTISNDYKFKDFISLHSRIESPSNLSSEQLQEKVAHLLTVLDYRAKLEVMRLKEFLSLQERKMRLLYQSVYLKQRLIYEDTLLRKLGEQEDRIVKKIPIQTEGKR